MYVGHAVICFVGLWATAHASIILSLQSANSCYDSSCVGFFKQSALKIK